MDCYLYESLCVPRFIRCDWMLLKRIAVVCFGDGQLAYVKQLKYFFMKRKKLIVSILLGAAVGGVVIYFLGTKKGKKELAELKKTGKVLGDTFKTLGKEVERNEKQARKEDRNKMLKAVVQEALAV